MASAEKGAAVIDRERARTGGPRFPRVWLDDLTVDLTSDYLVKGMIGAKQLVLIYGPAGDGKTFFTLDLGAHIAAGIPWRGRRVRGGLVVYVAAEAGASIQPRFFAWRSQKVGDARDEPVPLAIVTRGVNLLTPATVGALLAELRDISAEARKPLVLVIFDTLSRSMPGGDENKSEDMTRVIEVADTIRDQLAAACLLVHHTGKDGHKGARGHSSLFGAADVVVKVVDRVALIEKARDGVAGEQFAFELEVVELGRDQDGDRVTTCTVSTLGEIPKRGNHVRLSGPGTVGLQALKEAIRADGEALSETSTIPAGTRAVTIDAWRSQFQVRYGTDGDGSARGSETIRKAFLRARNELFKVRLVGVSDPYCWLLQ